MRKKLLSAALSMMLCLGTAVTAMAAQEGETVSGETETVIAEETEASEITNELEDVDYLGVFEDGICILPRGKGPTSYSSEKIGVSVGMFELADLTEEQYVVLKPLSDAITQSAKDGNEIIPVFENFLKGLFGRDIAVINNPYNKQYGMGVFQKAEGFDMTGDDVLWLHNLPGNPELDAGLLIQLKKDGTWVRLKSEFISALGWNEFDMTDFTFGDPIFYFTLEEPMTDWLDDEQPGDTETPSTPGNTEKPSAPAGNVTNYAKTDAVASNGQTVVIKDFTTEEKAEAEAAVAEKFGASVDVFAGGDYHVDGASEENPITITFKNLKGIGVGDSVCIYHKHADGKWYVEPATAGNGEVTATFTSFSNMLVVRTAKAQAGEQVNAGEQVGAGEHYHNFGTLVVEPTETTWGYTTYYCSCGYEYHDNYVAPLNAKAETNAVTSPKTGENAMPFVLAVAALGAVGSAVVIGKRKYSAR